MNANQPALRAEDIPNTTPVALFVETVGQALFVAAGESAFTNRLVSSLAEYAPRLDPVAVINVGALQLSAGPDPADAQAILASYLQGCKVDRLVSVARGMVASAVAVPVGRREFQKWAHQPHVP